MPSTKSKISSSMTNPQIDGSTSRATGNAKSATTSTTSSEKSAICARMSELPTPNQLLVLSMIKLLGSDIY